MVVRGGTVCLPMPPSWPEVPFIYFLNDCFVVATHERLWRVKMIYLNRNRSCLQGFQWPISIPEFLLHIEGQSFGVPRWLLSGLSAQPGRLACPQLLQWQSLCGCWPCSCSGHVAVERECASTGGECGRDRAEARTSLFPAIMLAWVRGEQGAFLKEPINFSSFCGLFDGFIP